MKMIYEVELDTGLYVLSIVHLELCDSSSYELEFARTVAHFSPDDGKTRIGDVSLDVFLDAYLQEQRDQFMTPDDALDRLIRDAFDALLD